MKPNKDSEVLVFPLVAPTNGNVIAVNPLHPEKADPPMLVTLFGIVTLVRPLQPKNA